MKMDSRHDTFTVSGDVDATRDKVLEHLRALGMKPSSNAAGIQVHSGSDLVFRLFGAAIPLGAKNLPVGLDVRLSSEGGRAVVKSSAYDRLGWYINDRPVWGGEEILQEKLSSLLSSVRTALGQPPEPTANQGQI